MSRCLTGPAPESVSFRAELPLSVQLSWRLRALILTARRRDGDRLPSIRAQAERAEVNVDTVRAVYDNLEADGLISARQGLGSFVAAGVEPVPRLEEIAAEALRRTEAAGRIPRELAIVVAAMATGPLSASAATSSEAGRT